MQRGVRDRERAPLSDFISPSFFYSMGKKAAKSTRKFAASGQLKKTIQARRRHRDIKKKAEKRQARKGKGKAVAENSDGSDAEDEGVEETSGK